MRTLRIVLCVIVAMLVVLPLAAKPAKKKGAASSRCSFDHYPVAVGSVSEYRTTSKQLDASGNVVDQTTTSYSGEVISVDEAEFRTRNVGEGNSSESTWLCGDEGISFRYDEYPETRITSSGVSVPSKLEVGTTWTHTFTMEGAGVNQTTSTVSRVTGRELVAVPVGTFEAWRVESESRTVAQGSEPSVLRMTLWYATSVGLLKSTFAMPFEMGEIRSVESVTELVRQSVR